MKKTLIYLILAVVMCSFASAVPDGGEIFYKFSDNLLDDWNSNDGTGSSISYSSSYPTFNLSGDGSPKSVNFATAGAYVSDGDITIQDNITLSYWYNGGIDTTSQRFIAKGNTGSVYFNDIMLTRYSTTDKIDVIFGCGGTSFNRFRTTTSPLSNTGWHNVVLVINTVDDVEFYHDGVLQADSQESDLCDSFYDSSDDLMLAADEYYGSGNDYNGLMDSFQFYTIALNQTKVSQIYNYGVVNDAVIPGAPTESTESTALVEQVGDVTFS